MKRLISLCLLLAACNGSGPIPPAGGQLASDNVSWTLATTYVDGTALTVGPGPRQMRETLIQWGLPGGPYNLGSLRVAAPGTSATIARGATDYRRCYIAFTVLNDLSTSVGTGEVCKNINPPPSNPTGLTVN
jgi:hypothetical protein